MQQNLCEANGAPSGTCFSHSSARQASKWSEGGKRVFLLRHWPVATFILTRLSDADGIPRQRFPWDLYLHRTPPQSARTTGDARTDVAKLELKQDRRQRLEASWRGVYHEHDTHHRSQHLIRGADHRGAPLPPTLLFIFGKCGEMKKIDATFVKLNNRKGSCKLTTKDFFEVAGKAVAATTTAELENCKIFHLGCDWTICGTYEVIAT